MSGKPNRIRNRVFGVAATVSLLLGITFLVLWNASWDEPIRALNTVRMRRVGNFEITNQLNRLSIHHVSQSEQETRDHYADFVKTSNAYIDQTDAKLRMLSAQLTQLRWGSAAYHAALQKLNDAKAERAAHVFHPPIRPAPVKPEIVVNLPIATAGFAITSVLCIVLVARRSRSRIAAWVDRHINWPEAKTLTRIQRARRRFGSTIAFFSLTLMLFSMFLWARSYLASDQYRMIWVATGQFDDLVSQTDWIIYRGAVSVSRGSLRPSQLQAPQAAIKAVDYYGFLNGNGRTALPPAGTRSIPGTSRPKRNHCWASDTSRARCEPFF